MIWLIEKVKASERSAEPAPSEAEGTPTPGTTPMAPQDIVPTTSIRNQTSDGSYPSAFVNFPRFLAGKYRSAARASAEYTS